MEFKNMEFKNPNDKTSIFFYKAPATGEWFFKFLKYRQHLKRAVARGPFASQGDALLAASMSSEFNFSEYVQRR